MSAQGHVLQRCDFRCTRSPGLRARAGLSRASSSRHQTRSGGLLRVIIRSRCHRAARTGSGTRSSKLETIINDQTTIAAIITRAINLSGGGGAGEGGSTAGKEENRRGQRLKPKQMKFLTFFFY